MLLSWDNIHFHVKRKEILRGLSGRVQYGELTAVIGPSGSGKTTLLNILSGRCTTGNTTGNVSINHDKIHASFRKKSMAYVMQEDYLLETQTPRECIRFSAELRLPSYYSKCELNDRIDDVIKSLHLEPCADTIIGSVSNKGISGGEKKRTSIGVEIVSSPDIILLDEPTSGLDSYSAYTVVQVLNDMVHQDKVVIATIHQPSSEVFDLFSRVYIMANGSLVYNGYKNELTKYLSFRGFVCKEMYNPSDYIMFLLGEEESRELLTTSWNDHASYTNEHISDVSFNLCEVDLESDCIDNQLKALQSLEYKHTPYIPNGYARSFGRQLCNLIIREFRHTYRNRCAIYTQLAGVIFLNTITGIVFMNSAKWVYSEEEFTYGKFNEWLQNHFGAITQVAIGALFSISQPIILSFPLERPLFIREYTSGMYSSIPYFITKSIVEVPIAFIQSGIIMLITYYLMGFQGNFFFLTCSLALLGLTASSLSVFLGSIAKNVNIAVQLTPILTVPQILFAGFFISINQIPIFIRWFQYLCSLKYGLNLTVLAEFTCLPPGFPKKYNKVYYNAVIGCDEPISSIEFYCDEVTHPNALLPRNDIYVTYEWIYFGILIGIFVVFRVAACIILTTKTRLCYE